MDVRFTHIGGPTLLIEAGGWRMLDRPHLRSPGGKYRFGWGSGSEKTAGPAIAPDQLGQIDAVLLSHDHHGDNLDPTGRNLLPSLGVVVTTVPGAKRLGGGARGLEPWATTRLEAADRPTIEITATPCRHGPPLSRPIVGDVIGFSLVWEGQEPAPSGSRATRCCIRACARWPTASTSEPRSCTSAACAFPSAARSATR